jgi:hypothetical protein
MSIAEWVRQALDQAHRREPKGRAGKKLEVIRAAARGDYPTADIDRMLAEIEMGITQILSFDSGFDGFPGITRLS